MPLPKIIIGRNILKVKSAELEGLINDDFVINENGQKFFVVFNDPFNNLIESHDGLAAETSLKAIPYENIVRIFNFYRKS